MEMNKRNSISVLAGIVVSAMFALPLAFIVAAWVVWANESVSPMGPPTRLMIPAIALDSPITPVGIDTLEINGQTYGIWQVRDDEVGWHNLSANLGQAGNTVLSGHSDIKAKIFGDLHRLNIDDEIIAFSGDRPRRYLVAEKFLVQEKGVPLETRIKNAQLIAPTQDERLTLVTCARPGATHRLIIIARPTASIQDAIDFNQYLLQN
jgi:sortase (surface protein transpeptidase)